MKRSNPNHSKNNDEIEKLNSEMDRRQVGIKIDVVLWRKFRAKCLENGITAGAKIEALIKKHLSNPYI